MSKETADYLMNFVRDTIVEALKVQYLDEEFAVGECSVTFDTHSMKVTLELTDDVSEGDLPALSLERM